MAKMNKEQREIVHTMLQEAAAKKFNKTFAATLKKFKCNVTTSRNYRNGNYVLSVYLSTSKLNTASCVKSLYNDALKAKSFKVSLNRNNEIITKFNAFITKQADKLQKPLKAIEAAIEKFNSKMDNEFLLTTAFNDIEDVHTFVKDFIK